MSALLFPIFLDEIEKKRKEKYVKFWWRV